MHFGGKGSFLKVAKLPPGVVQAKDFEGVGHSAATVRARFSDHEFGAGDGLATEIEKTPSATPLAPWYHRDYDSRSLRYLYEFD